MQPGKFTMARNATPKDTTYSWVLVTACYFAYMTCVGNAKTFSLLYTELLEHFGKGSAETAWVGSISFFLGLGFAPVSNYLCIIFTFQKVLIAGSIFSAGGFFLTSFVPRLEFIYITLGILTGIGYGLIISPSMTVINYYFEKRRALANGLIVSGSGVGNFIFPYIYRFLIDEYGLRGALTLMGGVLLQVCVAGSMIRQPLELQHKSIKTECVQENESGTLNEDHSGIENTSQYNKSTTTSDKTYKYSKNCCHCNFRSTTIDFSVFQNLSYTVFTVGATIHMNGYLSSLIMLSPYAVSLGYTKKEADLILSFVGGGEVFGRIFFGLIADKHYVKLTYIFSSCVMFSGISAIVISFVNWYPAIILYGIIVGFFSGALFSLMSVIVIDAVGMEKFPSAFGKSLFLISTASFIGPPIAGWIEDTTGAWLWSFRFSGSTSIIGGLLVLAEPCISKWWCYHSDKGVEKDEDRQMTSVGDSSLQQVH